MAATLENLAHAESMERLRLSYKIGGMAPGNLNATQVESLLDIYMAGYITRLNLTRTPLPSSAYLIGHSARSYPGWEAVRTWVRQVKNETAVDRDIFSSVDISHLVTRIGDKYGRWQAYECDDLKRTLFGIEDDGTGRVSLSKFYDSHLNHGNWQFTESADYLRATGALDESNPSNPRVIVPNYILSPSNCVAASSYYSVCCLDECEDFVDHLEKEIRAPTATPARIVELVAAMPPSTFAGQHTISALLLNRLDEIAARNDGQVPIHGRLFAQWMHHVYPRECPYPALPGTTKTLRSRAFEQETGLKSTASKKEMKQAIAVTPTGEESNVVTWSDEDELYVERPPTPIPGSERSSVWAAARFAVFFVPAFSMALFLLRVGRAAEADTYGQDFSKHDFSKTHFV